MSALSRIQIAALLAMSHAGLSPTLSLDFTTAVPAQVTFSRTGSRTAIVGGVVTTVASGAPAIESWNGKNYGLSIEPASSNIVLQSNAFSTSWTAEQATVTSGTTGPDGTTSGWLLNEDTSTNYHGIRQDITGFAAGDVVTASCFFSSKAGATRWGAMVRAAIQYNNFGARTAINTTGDQGCFYYTDTNFTNINSGVQTLANGWWRAWVTAKAVAAGTLRFGPRVLYQDSSGGDIESYAGATTEGCGIAFFQVERGVARPTSYKATTTASASTSADSAVITDISWLNATQGTFVIEHDVASGVLLGSGTNTVIAGQTVNPRRGTAKTALAWDGTTSDLVTDGGASTTGGVPTFGADIRLLSTSATTNAGHIKSLSYYPQRLTVAQIQALTAPASTASPGAWRVASIRNRLPIDVQAITGTTPSFVGRWPVTIGSGNLTKLRLNFANWWGSDTGGTNTGNAVIIDKVSLERVSVAESVPVTFGGLRTLTLSDGDTDIVSDDILPSSFTSYSQFAKGDQFYIRVQAHVASTGQNVPVSRWSAETNAQSYIYDAAVTTLATPVDGTGALSFTGSAPTIPSKGFAPIVIGVYASGDPWTQMNAGDSIVEGVGDRYDGSYAQKVMVALGYSTIEFAKGGQGMRMGARTTQLAAYMKYVRVFWEEYGTNDQGRMLDFIKMYSIARANGIGLIARPSLLPRTTSTDSWATEANQTTSRTYPSKPEQVVSAMQALGWIDSYYYLTSARGVNTDKWVVNGTAGYATAEGVHPTDVIDNALATEYQPVLAALTLT